MEVPLRRKKSLDGVVDKLVVTSAKRGRLPGSCVTKVVEGDCRDSNRFPGATKSGLTIWSIMVGPFDE